MTQPADTINICMNRGDTYGLVFTIKDSSGTAIDITGYSFLMTVDPSSEPTDADENLFQISGTITDASAGQVTFTPSSANTDQTPGVYRYDIQMTTTGSEIRTIVVGTFEIIQDITK